MKLLTLLGVLLVVPFAAAGCGGDAGDTVALEPVAEAAAKTTNAGSSRLEFTVAMRAAGQSFTFRGSGAFDYAPPRGRMTMDFSDLAAQTGADFGDGKMQLVFDGLVYYMKLPKGAEGLGAASTKWIKVDLARAGAAGGLDLGALQQANQNPAQLMQFLRGASDDVEELGEAEVRGVETTRYRATIDLERAAEVTAEIGDFSTEMREQVRAGVKTFEKQLGRKTLPVEVWVDADGLLRRMQMKLGFPVEGEPVQMNMTMEFFDFGVQVGVERPPASQTIDVTALVTPERS